MNKPLFLFVGKSASGKTTIADMLEQKYGYRQVRSYTTRPPRYDGEIGHIFVTKDEFDKLDEFAAYTLYNDYEYGTTSKQLDDCDIFVVNVPGVELLLQKYQNTTRPIVIIYFDTTVTTRIDRMIDRNDNDHDILGRLLEDDKYDWYKKLNSLVWHHINIEHKNVDLFSIDANKNLLDVMEQVLYYINKYVED